MSLILKKAGFLLVFVGLILVPTGTYPIFSYFTAFRDMCTTRISDVSEEDIMLLENQEDPLAKMEAARLRTTRADFAEPFVSLAFNDMVGDYIHTPLNYLGSTTGFSVIYNWFSKKLTRAQVVPAFIKGLLSGAVIFAITQVVSKKLYPAWVTKNYYAHTVASRLCAQFAVACGVGLLGIQTAQ